MVYLHGGYDGTFPKIEALLDGHELGFETTVQLEPGDAFGEYDPELLKIEPRVRFPEPIEIGMQFEGIPEALDEQGEIVASDDDAGDDDDLQSLIYTVTDVADSQVVLDGNHPLAGMALRFTLLVTDIRSATEEEIQNRHPEGVDAITFGMPNDDEDDVDLDQLIDAASGTGKNNPRTLH
jgi:FKBP-type peptidyl-prolyl cis-trans isomerase SlyD